MRTEKSGRARDARMMNGVMTLGGRSASAREVDLALGVDGRPGRSSGLARMLAAIARWARVRMGGRSPRPEAHVPACAMPSSPASGA